MWCAVRRSVQSCNDQKVEVVTEVSQWLCQCAATVRLSAPISTSRPRWARHRHVRRRLEELGRATEWGLAEEIAAGRWAHRKVPGEVVRYCRCVIFLSSFVGAVTRNSIIAQSANVSDPGTWLVSLSSGEEFNRDIASSLHRNSPDGGWRWLVLSGTGAVSGRWWLTVTAPIPPRLAERRLTLAQPSFHPV